MGTLSKKILDEFEKVAGKYPDRRAALLPLFWIIQKEEGRLSDESIAAAAERVGCSAAQAIETASFYTMYHAEKRGRHHLQVCRTLSCELTGAGDLSEAIRRVLGLEPGGITPDGQFSFETVECLACCHAGPCLMVNEERHLHMTGEKIEALIELLRKA